MGILASLDICAIDQASVDLIYAMKEEDHHDLVERIKTRHGLRQLSYMQELGMGNRKYKLIDLDNNQSPLTLQEAVAHVVPFVEPKKCYPVNRLGRFAPAAPNKQFRAGRCNKSAPAFLGFFIERQ